MAAEHSLHHRAFVKFEVVLFEHAHAFAGALDHITVCGRQLAAEYAHECGLAGAVGSDDAIAVARGEFHVYVLKQYPFAELHAEIIDRYHICVALDCKFIGNRLQSYEKTLKIRYFACRL